MCSDCSRTDAGGGGGGAKSAAPADIDARGDPALDVSGEGKGGALAVVHAQEPRATGAFCGPATPKAGGDGQRAATIPTKEQRATDPPVAFSAAELAAMAEESAARGGTARGRLLRGTKLAEAAAVFVDGRHERDSRSVKKQQVAAATTWLIDAMKTASLDPAIAAGVKQLLAARQFTRNLATFGQWNRLQEELRKAMLDLGEKRLAPLFDRFNLGTAMSAATVAMLFTVHPLAANLNGRKPSQELALPALVAVLRKRYEKNPNRNCLCMFSSRFSVKPNKLIFGHRPYLQAELPSGDTPP